MLQYNTDNTTNNKNPEHNTQQLATAFLDYQAVLVAAAVWLVFVVIALLMRNINPCLGTEPNPDWAKVS